MSMGSLKITCLSGENLYNCDRYFSQDPYVQFTLGTAFARTSILRGGGTNVTWAETVEVMVHPKHSRNEDTIKVECWDHDFLKRDDLIGKGVFDVSKLILSTTSTSSEGLVQLTRQSKDKEGAGEVDAGKVKVQVTWIPLATQEEYDAYVKAVFKAAVKKVTVPLVIPV
ncbi:C2 domain-containing protein [Catenaria anguillulae PL171]|uniref:C2 domain-containing protein n=1 Tax=Catenaria anguillulae PL171 TaxID=765915 RepID=A0A1Y2I1H7_9FUNG|nr:C2 domain-containing protein [Catenaria anguillulae PL171]